MRVLSNSKHLFRPAPGWGSKSKAGLPGGSRFFIRL